MWTVNLEDSNERNNFFAKMDWEGGMHSLLVGYGAPDQILPDWIDILVRKFIHASEDLRDAFAPYQQAYEESYDWDEPD